MKDMKKKKQTYKKDLVEEEKNDIEKTETIEQDHNRKQQIMIDEKEGELLDMEKNYEGKLGKMKEDL